MFRWASHLSVLLGSVVVSGGRRRSGSEMKRCSGSSPPAVNPKIPRRVTDGGVDGVASAETLAEVVSGGRGQSTVRVDLGCVFISASEEAVAAADFSSFSGVGQCDDLFEEPEDEELSHVHVPGAVWPVKLSRQVILKQVVHSLELHVYGFGVVIEDGRTCRGWIDMDTPPSGFGDLRIRRKFYGVESGDRYGAMESVCDAVIVHMVNEANVEVRDVNYEKMKVFKGEAAAQRNWSILLSDFLKDSKMESAALRKRCGKIFLEMKRLCNEFSDLLHTQCMKSGGGEGVGAVSVMDLKCISNTGLDAWPQNFGARLVTLIDEGADIIGIAGGVELGE